MFSGSVLGSEVFMSYVSSHPLARKTSSLRRVPAHQHTCLLPRRDRGLVTLGWVSRPNLNQEGLLYRLSRYLLNCLKLSGSEKSVRTGLNPEALTAWPPLPPLCSSLSLRLPFLSLLPDFKWTSVLYGMAQHPPPHPCSGPRGQKGGCPQNQRIVSALFQRTSKAAGRGASDLLCRVV